MRWGIRVPNWASLALGNGCQRSLDAWAHTAQYISWQLLVWEGSHTNVKMYTIAVQILKTLLLHLFLEVALEKLTGTSRKTVIGDLSLQLKRFSPLCSQVCISAPVYRARLTCNRKAYEQCQAIYGLPPPRLERKYEGWHAGWSLESRNVRPPDSWEPQTTVALASDHRWHRRPNTRRNYFIVQNEHGICDGERPLSIFFTFFKERLSLKHWHIDSAEGMRYYKERYRVRNIISIIRTITHLNQVVAPCDWIRVFMTNYWCYESRKCSDVNPRVTHSHFHPWSPLMHARAVSQPWASELFGLETADKVFGCKSPKSLS